MSFIEVASKEYEINNSSTPNRTVDLSDPVRKQANENDLFVFNQFDYERYLDSEIHLERRFKQMTVKKTETKQKSEEIPVDSIMLAPKVVKQR